MKRTNTAKWIESRKMWRIDVQKDGVRRSFYSSTPGRNGQREANRKADAWLDDGVDTPSMRMDEILDAYLERVKATTSTGQYRKETYHVEKFVRPIIGKKKAVDITDLDMQKILDKAFRHPGQYGAVKELSRKSMQNIRTTLYGIAKIVRKSRIAYLNPDDWEIPKSARKKGKSILQPESLAVLFSTDSTIVRGKPAEEIYIHAYRFEVLTGLRPGELMGLQIADVQGDRVLIRRSINDSGEITRGKNDNAIRAVALSDLARHELALQLQEPPGNGSVFGITSQVRYRRHWQRYCAANGIPYITPYELRHTFVSVVKNLPEGEIKSLVGHSKSMDTFGIYSHAIDGEEQQVAIRVNSLFVELLEKYRKK